MIVANCYPALWEDYCLQFLEYLNECESQGPIIILLTHARIKEAQCIVSCAISPLTLCALRSFKSKGPMATSSLARVLARLLRKIDIAALDLTTPQKHVHLRTTLRFSRSSVPMLIPTLTMIRAALSLAPTGLIMPSHSALEVLTSGEIDLIGYISLRLK